MPIEKNRIITDDAYLINSSGEYVTAVAVTPRRQANRETIEAAPQPYPFMLAVKFLQPYAPYEPGHVVDLPDALAESLIASGTCRAYNSPVLPAQVATTQNDSTVTGGTNA